MNLFQYILLPFGLSLRHKTLDNIFTGISVSMFGLVFTTIMVSIPFCNTTKTIIFRFSSLAIQMSYIAAYYLLKKRSEDIYGMFDAILEFEKKQTPKERLKFGFSLISFITCLMLTYVLSIYLVLTNQEYYNLFALNQFFNQVILYYNPIPIPIVLTFLFFIYWMFVIQFIHFEFCYKYYNLLIFSNTVIEKYLCFRPNFLIRYQINEVIEDFEENDKQFNQSLKPLKLIILLLFISVNFQFSITIWLLSGSQSIYPCCFAAFTVNLYLIITQIITQIKSKIQNILIQNINVWKDSDDKNKPLLVTHHKSINNKNISS